MEVLLVEKTLLIERTTVGIRECEVIMLQDLEKKRSSYVYTNEVNYQDWVIEQVNCFRNNGYKIFNFTELKLKGTEIMKTKMENYKGEIKKEKKNLKTQISSLRSGTERQYLNPDIDYSGLPKSTQHNGHSGTNAQEVFKIWEKVKLENPKELDVVIMGLRLKIKAKWSISGRSVNYIAFISNENLKEYFKLDPSRTGRAFISISGKDIMVSNGRNSYVHICPSLVEIL